ncbi:MAG: hypothetical protein JWP87_2026 [Labilithrix sp.]|nr:hypothetical protein [Labilithrix sp.]
MNEPALVIALVLAGVTSAVACSSKTSDSAAAPIVTPRPDSGTCTSACCELPVPGTTCAVDAGTTCTYAVTCAEGLVLSRTTSCESGVWQSVNDCPAPGGEDARGCPGSQPASGTPCALDGGAGGNCGYSKTCDAKVCDGGDCVPVRTSAQANCINGTWQTTPLGPC